ncbi:MAG: Wadjet anti-phage system protein JetD domain-containing protein [Succinivibrio sp.]
MVFPEEVISRVVKNEITNRNHLIERLRGNREYPLTIPLKLPTANEILSDIAKYQEYVIAWKKYPHQECVRRKTVSYKNGINGFELANEFVIDSYETLLKVIPAKDRKLIECVKDRCDEVLKVLGLPYASDIYTVLRMLEPEEVSVSDFKSLIVLLPQLKRGVGSKMYIRAIPLEHIDTKFLENNLKLVAAILRCCQILNAQESLEEYLGVIPKPEGFAHMIVNSQDRELMYPYIQIPTYDLERIEPPGRNLLIIENVQSGLMVPSLPETTVIFGCGKNLSWAKANWLKNKSKIVYWGDLDSWGFSMLSYFRKISSCNVMSVMMDEKTIEYSNHKDRMVKENISFEEELECLTNDERATLYRLREDPEKNRLEQEKLDEKYVVDTLLSVINQK